MPVTPTFPGLYPLEVPSGVRMVTPVATSIALFVGMARRGRVGVPTRILGYANYERRFGNDTTLSEMTDQVRQAFLNGTSDAWVVRIAHGAIAARVDLRNEARIPVLTAIAREAGPDGNLVRVDIDYDSPRPEQSFNMRVVRLAPDARGVMSVETQERFSDITTNTLDHYVVTTVGQQSDLIDVTLAPGLATTDGFSRAGVLLEATDAAALATLNTLLSSSANSLQISVDGSPLTPVVIGTPLTAVQDIEDDLNLALATHPRRVLVRLMAGPGTSRYLEIRSVRMDGSPNPGGAVEIQAGLFNDVTAALQLGTARGGIEVSGHAGQRPVPNGVFAQLSSASTLSALTAFAGASDLGTWTLTDGSGFGPYNGAPTFASPGSPMYLGTAYTGPGVGSLRNVRQNLQILADSINANAVSPTGPRLWQASLQGYRLVLRPLFGDANADVTATLTSSGAYNLGGVGQFFDGTANVVRYSLGSTGIGNFQGSGVDGTPGALPTLADYRAAFDIVDREVDLFNLMVLPRAAGQSDADREGIWSPASTFCQKRRAFLLVDPRSTWDSAETVSSEIADLRIGVAKDHCAVYWPRLEVSGNGSRRVIDPSGSLAGLMARIDSTYGVWRSAAGTAADLRGVRRVEYRISDDENGLINPQAVNAIRVFPNGIVSWGARTMDGFDNSGNTDYRYCAVRRTALLILESLTRNLRWVVFESNDEPLWAQIRLTVGAFMHDLFRQGAFKGTKREAYFVKCDRETTPDNDVLRGLVNIWVGFSPLRPAEFVVIYLQQMAGQIQT